MLSGICQRCGKVRHVTMERRETTNLATPFQNTSRRSSCKSQSQAGRVILLRTIKHYCSKSDIVRPDNKAEENSIDNSENLKWGQNQLFLPTSIEDQRPKLRILVNSTDIKGMVDPSDCYICLIVTEKAH